MFLGIAYSTVASDSPLGNELVTIVQFTFPFYLAIAIFSFLLLVLFVCIRWKGTSFESTKRVQFAEQDVVSEVATFSPVVLFPGRTKGEVCQSILRTLGFRGVNDFSLELSEADIDQVRDSHRKVLKKRAEFLLVLYDRPRPPKYLFNKTWERYQYLAFINIFLRKHNRRVYASKRDHHQPYMLSKIDQDED